MTQQPMLMPYTAADVERCVAEVVAAYTELERCQEAAKFATAERKLAQENVDLAVRQLRKARAGLAPPVSEALADQLAASLDAAGIAYERDMPVGALLRERD